MKPPVKIRSMIFVTAAFLALSHASLPASDENINPDSWVYSALRTFELKGLIVLPPEMPYSRREVESYLENILRNIEVSGIQLSPRQDFLLKRLMGEFEGKEDIPSRREDGPLLCLKEREDFAALDLRAGAAFVKDVEAAKGELEGYLDPSALISISGKVTYESEYRLTMGPERGPNASRNKSGPRVRSFRGLTSEFERGYLAAGGENWRVTLGRDYLHWGNSRDEGLILSRGAGSLDHLSASYRLGRFELQALHALLDSSVPRRLAGHRLSARLPGNIYLGLSESVVYTGRSLDYAYLLPAGSFYANQYNESEDDNVLWGLDWKAPIRNWAVFYGEILVDDFQYEGRGSAPDRLGIDLCAETLFSAGDLDIELLLDYTYIDIFTYAHKDSLLTRYTVGDGGINNGIIGSRLGPDADRWRMKISAAVTPRLILSAEGIYIRRGEGNDLREWDRIEDPDPEFPSGQVTVDKEISVSALFDLGGGSFISGGAGLRERESNSSESEGFGYLRLILDI